jgi:hypothetical protein
MKIFALAALILLAFTSNSHADNRLFPTDLLQLDEVDFRISLNLNTITGEINLNGNSGMQSQQNYVESAQIRYGLGHNWYMGVSENYNLQDVIERNYTNPAN